MNGNIALLLFSPDISVTDRAQVCLACGLSYSMRQISCSRFVLVAITLENRRFGSASSFNAIMFIFIVIFMALTFYGMQYTVPRERERERESLDRFLSLARRYQTGIWHATRSWSEWKLRASVMDEFNHKFRPRAGPARRSR